MQAVVDNCGLSFRLREVYDIWVRLIEASIEGDGEPTKTETAYDLKLMLVVSRIPPLRWKGLLGSFDESICLRTWKDPLNRRKECLEMAVN